MIVRTQFSQSDNNALKQAFVPLVQYRGLSSPDTSEKVFIDLANHAKTAITTTLDSTETLQIITDFRRMGNRRSALYIKNAPKDEWPVSPPDNINEPVSLSIAHPMLAGLALIFNQNIASKRFENSIRFPINNVVKNQETWHGHPDYSYTLFYCQKGDPKAKTKVICAHTLAMMVFTHYPEGLNHLFEPQEFIKGQAPFSLISGSEQEGYAFAPQLHQTRSSLAQNIEALDLPDIQMCLRHWKDNLDANPDVKKTLTFLTGLLTMYGSLHDEMFVYERGDIVIYNEKTTARYSNSFEASDAKNPRWMQTLSVM